MADRAALLAQLAEIDGDQSKGSASVPQPPTAQPSVRRQELLGLLGEVEGGQFELDLARKKYAGQGMFAGGRGTVGAAARTFAIQSLPFGDLADVQGTSAHAERVKRFQEGKATSEDIDAIAKYEEEQAGLGRAYGKEFMGYKVGKLLPLVGAASKIIPEAEVGGAVIGRLGGLAGKAVPRLGRAGQSLQATRLGRVGLAGGQRVASAPLMPSLYYEQWKQKNVAEGRDPQDIRGLPVPLAQAAAMNLVLGTVQSKIGGSVPTMAGRALTKGAVGAGEDAALHAMQGAWDDIVVDRNKWVGEQYKTLTGYGALGDLVNGKAGEALKDVAVTALGFSVLAGIHEYGDLHERRQMEREERAELGRRAEGRLEGLTKSVHESARQAAADVVRANNDLITAYGTRGMSPEDAGEAIGALYGRVKQAQLAGMSREEAKSQFPDLPGDIRDPLFKLIDRTLPKESNLIRQKQAAPPDLKPTEVQPTAESEGKATEPPTTPAEPPKAETGTEPTRTPESPPDGAQEPSTAPERFYRVPSSKRLTEPNIEQARSELMGSFAGKWFSNTREGNEQYFTEGKVQYEFDPSKVDAEFLNRGERDSTLGGRNPMYLDPALTAIRYKGKETDPDFASFRDLIEGEGGFNAARAEAGLPPIHVEVVPPKGSHGKTVEQAPPESKPEPQKPQTLLDKMRARQKGQTATAKPQYPEPAKEAPVNAEAEFDRAGLTGTERYALGQALRGQGLRKIAADPKMAKLYGKNPSHQTIANILARAGKKLSRGDERIRAKIDEVLAQIQAEHKADLVEQGGRAAEDLLGDGDAVRGANQKADAWDKATDDIEAIADQWMKEAEDGLLTPERKAELEAQALAAHRAAAEGQPGEESAAPRVAGKVEGKAPRTPPKTKLTGKRKTAEPAAGVTRHGDGPKGRRGAIGPKSTKPKWATKESGLGEVLNEFGKAEGRTKEALEGALMNSGFLDGEGKPVKNPYEDYSAGERKQQLGRELASAHDYMNRYGQDTAPIERALEAIGAEREGSPGEVVAYNPSVHEDVPGLSTGSPVKVLRSGWSVPRDGGGFETVTKAKVEPSNLQPYYSGFPIPMEWVNAMTRWVFGSPRGPDPHFTPDTDPNPHNPRAMPSWKIAKEAAATQLGARIHTDAEKATTGYAWLKHVGEQVANEWQIGHANLDRAFEVAPDGTIGLANGQRGFMADVVKAEMQRPGSQPLTHEQKQAVDIWKGVLEKQLKAMEAAGLKKFYDEQGNPLSVSDLLQRGYLPQLVKPKTAIGEAWNSLFGRTAQTTGGRPGVKPGFRKRRVHQTEEEGVKAGTEYVTSFSTRVAEFIKQSNREIADHHLANDPLLGGVDRVKPLFRKLLAERKALKQSLTKQEWSEEVKRLRGLATQAATGNVFVAPAFRGKEYSPEVKAHLEMMYGDRGGRYLKFAQAASQELRNLVLGPDISYATLQLQGMLFSNPVRWARTMLRAGEAFFKRDTIQRLAQEDPGIRQAMQEITQAGGSIGTRPEQIASLGGGRSLAERIPGYERFGRAFSTAIDLAKIELWRANKPADPTQWPRTIEAIENSLGSGRMEQLGMSPERAFLERLFFLAPSYYRGYTKLLQQAFTPGSGGAVARKQLGFMASGVLLTGLAGLYGAYSLGWISEDELYERLNPSRGKFLMVPVQLSGDKRIEVGMGGFYVSMVRPLGRWYRGHSGSLPRAAADIGSGRDYFGNPISTEEAIAKSVLPIAVQDVVLGEGTPAQRAAQAGAGMVGFRSFPPSEKGEYVDRLRRFAQEKTGQPYSSLSLRDRARLVRQYSRVEKPPAVAPENQQVAQEREAAAQAERQKRLMGGVSAETRKKLSELGKVLPSYDVELAYGGVQIPMTGDERQRYEQLLVEEYNRTVARWPMGRLMRLNEKRREDYMRRELETAKERAKRRLMSPAAAR